MQSCREKFGGLGQIFNLAHTFSKKCWQTYPKKDFNKHKAVKLIRFKNIFHTNTYKITPKTHFFLTNTSKFKV